MNTVIRRLIVILGLATALGGLGATAARADDGLLGLSVDPQLLDVSHQVSDIQKKMGDLLARGQLAKAGTLLSSAACGYGESSTVFAPWGDMASYALAPQGDMLASDGWTLGKQSSVVSGGDPFTGAGQSLQLGNSAEAATPAMCVNLTNPTLRFFTRDVGGNGKADLKVDLLYEGLDGHVRHLTIAKLRSGQDWQPSAILPIYMNVLAAASPSGVTAVALQFKAEGLQKNETLSVSGIYVDPFCSR